MEREDESFVNGIEKEDQGEGRKVGWRRERERWSNPLAKMREAERDESRQRSRSKRKKGMSECGSCGEL